jgi:hypothetical protein
LPSRNGGVSILSGRRSRLCRGEPGPPVRSGGDAWLGTTTSPPVR